MMKKKSSKPVVTASCVKTASSLSLSKTVWIKTSPDAHADGFHAGQRDTDFNFDGKTHSSHLQHWLFMKKYVFPS